MRKNMERSVRISDQRLIDALQKMQDETGVPKATYIKQAIAEKLARMNIREISIAEIEEIENDSNYSDTI